MLQTFVFYQILINNNFHIKMASAMEIPTDLSDLPSSSSGNSPLMERRRQSELAQKHDSEGEFWAILGKFSNISGRQAQLSYRTRMVYSKSPSVSDRKRQSLLQSSSQYYTKSSYRIRRRVLRSGIKYNVEPEAFVWGSCVHPRRY